MRSAWLQPWLAIAFITRASAVKRQGHTRSHDLPHKPDETPLGLLRRVHQPDEHSATPKNHSGAVNRIWFQKGSVTSDGDITPWAPPLARRVPRGSSDQQVSAPTSVVIMGSGSIHSTDPDSLLDQGLMRRHTGPADTPASADPTAGTTAVAAPDAAAVPAVAPLTAAAAPGTAAVPTAVAVAAPMVAPPLSAAAAPGVAAAPAVDPLAAAATPVSGAAPVAVVGAPVAPAAPAAGAAPIAGVAAPITAAAPPNGAPVPAGLPAATGVAVAADAPVATAAPTATDVAPVAADAPVANPVENGRGISILSAIILLLIVGVLGALMYTMMRRSRARQSEGGRLLRSSSNALEGTHGSPRSTRFAPKRGSDLDVEDDRVHEKESTIRFSENAIRRPASTNSSNGQMQPTRSYRARREKRSVTWDGQTTSSGLAFRPACTSDQSDSDSRSPKRSAGGPQDSEDNKAEEAARKVTREALTNAAVTGDLHSALTTFAVTAQADNQRSHSPVSPPKRSLVRQGSGERFTKSKGVRISQEANVKSSGSLGLHDTRTDSRSLVVENVEV